MMDVPGIQGAGVLSPSYAEKSEWYLASLKKTPSITQYRQTPLESHGQRSKKEGIDSWQAGASFGSGLPVDERPPFQDTAYIAIVHSVVHQSQGPVDNAINTVAVDGTDGYHGAILRPRALDATWVRLFPICDVVKIGLQSLVVLLRTRQVALGGDDKPRLRSNV